MCSETSMRLAVTGTLRLERRLAGLLRYGTWLASLVIAVGLILTTFRPADIKVAGAGIVLFILLPVSRVLLMLFAFLGERDYRLALAAGLVLGIIVAGVVLGICTVTSIGG